MRLRASDPRDPLIVRGKWRDPSALALCGASGGTTFAKTSASAPVDGSLVAPAK